MPTRGWTSAWGCAALVLVRVVAVGVALDARATAPRHAALTGDERRYHQIATRRGIPYADFAVEYPPLTLAAIDALDDGTVRRSTARLMWSQVALDGLIAVLLAWGWGRRAALAYLVLGLAFVWYPFLYLRLDLLSVALAVAGLALLRRRHPVAGGAGVAAACFAKVWPIALVPGLVARRSWRGVVAFAAVGIAGTAAWIRWAGFDGPVQVLTFRGAKGWQIESTIGAVVHVFAAADARMQRGAARIGVVPGMLRVGLPLLGVLATFGIWWLVSRVPHAATHVVDGVAPVAALAAVLVFATLLSPQYVSWLLPFAAIAAAGGERRIAGLTAVVALLSTFGLFLAGDLSRGDPVAMALVLLRNGLLVALLGVAVSRLSHLARADAAVRPAPTGVAVVAGRARPHGPGPDLLGSADGRPDDRRTGARA